MYFSVNINDAEGFGPDDDDNVTFDDFGGEDDDIDDVSIDPLIDSRFSDCATVNPLPYPVLVTQCSWPVLGRNVERTIISWESDKYSLGICEKGVANIFWGIFFGVTGRMGLGAGTD